MQQVVDDASSKGDKEVIVRLVSSLTLRCTGFNNRQVALQNRLKKAAPCGQVSIKRIAHAAA